MPTLYTWHSADFDITADQVDRSKSSYSSSVEGYEEKISALSNHFGTDQHVFCFVSPEQHVYYETDRTVEWIVEAQDEDLLGYVDNGRWESYLNGECCMIAALRTGFTGIEDWSAILKLPVPNKRLRRKRSYRWISINRAEVLDDQVF